MYRERGDVHPKLTLIQHTKIDPARRNRVSRERRQVAVAVLCPHDGRPVDALKQDLRRDELFPRPTNEFANRCLAGDHQIE
jgi:hypothetical protein